MSFPFLSFLSFLLFSSWRQSRWPNLYICLLAFDHHTTLTSSHSHPYKFSSQHTSTFNNICTIMKLWLKICWQAKHDRCIMKLMNIKYIALKLTFSIFDRCLSDEIFIRSQCGLIKFFFSGLFQKKIHNPQWMTRIFDNLPSSSG